MIDDRVPLIQVSGPGAGVQGAADRPRRGEYPRRRTA